MILKYYKDCGDYKEVMRTDKKLFICPFCGEEFRGLAYHTNQKHGITSKQLKKMMGLKSNYQLITPDLKDRHRQIVEDNYNSHVKNNLQKKGVVTRYKKGDTGHTKDNWSPQALKDISKRFK